LNCVFHALQLTIVTYVLLFVFEDFSTSMIVCGVVAQLCHLLIMRTFPFVNVTSIPFIGSLGEFNYSAIHVSFYSFKKRGHI
jgi:hypothetical protein